MTIVCKLYQEYFVFYSLINNWINQKEILEIVLFTTIATTQIPYQSVLALTSATVNQITKRSTVRIDGAGNDSGVIINEDSQR